MMRWTALPLALAVFLAGPALADDKKKKDSDTKSTTLTRSSPKSTPIVRTPPPPPPPPVAVTPIPRPTYTPPPRPTYTATPRPTYTPPPRPVATPTPRPTYTPPPRQSAPARPSYTPPPRPVATPTPRPSAPARPSYTAPKPPMTRSAPVPAHTPPAPVTTVKPHDPKPAYQPRRVASPHPEIAVPVPDFAPRTPPVRADDVSFPTPVRDRPTDARPTPTRTPPKPPSWEGPGRTPFGDDNQHTDLGDKPTVDLGRGDPKPIDPGVIRREIPGPGSDEPDVVRGTAPPPKINSGPRGPAQPSTPFEPYEPGYNPGPGTSDSSPPSGGTDIGRPPRNPPPSSTSARPPRSDHSHDHHCHGYGWDHFAVFYPRAPYGPSYRGVRYTNPDRYQYNDGPSQRIRVDTESEWSVSAGITALHSGYERADGLGVADPWSDLGGGVAVRYKPGAEVGFEVGAIRYGDAFGEVSERNHTAVQASMMLFMTPRKAASLYVLGGGTAMGRDVQDTYWDGEQAAFYEQHAPITAGHVGVGVELSPADRWFVDIEGRYVAYSNRTSQAPALPGAVQTSLALGHRF